MPLPISQDWSPERAVLNNPDLQAQRGGVGCRKDIHNSATDCERQFLVVVVLLFMLINQQVNIFTGQWPKGEKDVVLLQSY